MRRMARSQWALQADLDPKLWFGVLSCTGKATAFPISYRRKPCYRSLTPNI
jgi:hypothetical protein